MSKEKVNIALMFADIAESTRLYEILGDTMAQEEISRCLSRMSEIILNNDGAVVKTIGDEIMCRFAGANDAVQAACDIQRALTTTALSDNTDNKVSLSVRIGVHCGPVILKNKDLFGDTVNVAARMAGIAKAKQIIVTEQTVTPLAPQRKALIREFDHITIKGKQQPINLYQVIWAQDNLTTLNVNPAVRLQEVAPVLTLSYRGTRKKMTTSSKIFAIGRGNQCDMTINSISTSRVHARIESRRGKFIFVDESTNGTYIRTKDGEDVYLRREELLLVGDGAISLGSALSDDNEHIIYFSITNLAFA